MEAIRDLLKSEKEVNQEVKNLFVGLGMNVEGSNDTATLEEYEELGVNQEQSTLGEIKGIWDNLNRQKVEKCEKEKIKDMKLACNRCLTQDFEKLEAPPRYEDYERMFFVKSERIINTKLKEGRNEKIIKGVNHFFQCECCQARNCISIEEEIN